MFFRHLVSLQMDMGQVARLPNLCTYDIFPLRIPKGTGFPLLSLNAWGFERNDAKEYQCNTTQDDIVNYELLGMILSMFCNNAMVAIFKTPKNKVCNCTNVLFQKY